MGKGNWREMTFAKALRQKGEKMRRAIVLVFLLALMLLAVGAAPAFAKVHGVSQAGCAAAGAPSGATASGGNSPGGPIPVTVSPFLNVATFPGQGGDGDGACDVK